MDNKALKQELSTVIEANNGLKMEIDSLEKTNGILLSDIEVYNGKIDSLENKVSALKKQKNKTIETIKYIETGNDTINKLLALNRLNDTIIGNLEKISFEKDSVIRKQALVISNDKEIINGYKILLETRERQLEAYNKEIVRQKREKMIWQLTTGAGVIAIIILAL